MKNKQFKTGNGTPIPYGATSQDQGINFSLFSKSADTVLLCLFQNEKQIAEIPLKKEGNKTGDVFHIFVYDLPKDLLYAYKIDSSDKLLLDPFAKATASLNHNLLGVVLHTQEFEWQGVKKPKLQINELIIYEAHVRGFTIDESSHAFQKGTFLGIIEKIPYLKELGINAIELMPVFEFDKNEYKGVNPLNGNVLCNYWGYSTLNFFSLANLYASSKTCEAPLLEFKTLVRELHKAGIEVILDVVFNHTGEGNEEGPTLSFKGIDNSIYYMLDSENHYMNFSGCGNTFSCNRPISMKLILEVLRYFVVEAHVDGFRFDLASIFYRDSKGHPQKNSKLVDLISEDPILADIKLMAEPWDAAGFYQVGRFYPENIRWSEWNAKYRDDVRSFLNGFERHSGSFATSICGSVDLYHKRAPFASINFITSHDGFSLRDLVSYNTKHNLANGEDNRDGLNYNRSYNFGVEGKTSSLEILTLRERQMKNFHFALMISQGVPLLYMGDEYGHTKDGNNNTWCQDNPLSWFLWDQLEENKEFYRFYRKMIAFRKQNKRFRNKFFLTENDIFWHGLKPHLPNFATSFIAFTLLDHEHGEDFYIAFNAQNHEAYVELPTNKEGYCWYLVVNTAATSPNDFFEEEWQMPFTQKEFNMLPFSSLLFKEKQNRS